MKKSAVTTTVAVFTIGHSTHTLSNFLHLLQAHGVARLVDVRTIPRSRHNPQFNKETLPAVLRSAGLSYQHVAGLGGLRHARPDSLNKAWNNLSFRGFADYMQTSEFKEHLQVLIDLTRQERVALMCAEALPWRCHRSMIADALVARGLEVEHIMSATHCQKHTLRPFALVKGTRVTYPAESVTEASQSSETRVRQRSSVCKGDPAMAESFKVGDHVSWNSEAGRVRGTIKKKITSEITFKRYKVHASKVEPQYLIDVDKTDHQAMHKGSALKKIGKSKN